MAAPMYGGVALLTNQIRGKTIYIFTFLTKQNKTSTIHYASRILRKITHILVY